MKKLAVTIAVLLPFAVAPAMAKPYLPDPSAVPQTGMVSKAPVGSTVTIDSTGKFGTRYGNVFKVQPDKSLKLMYQYELPNQQNG